jgi:RHS repeat-associated protein
VSATGNKVRLGFTGHEQDDELGLVNMRGRMYDPRLGRFLTTDPIVSLPRDPQSYNRYSYVLNRPLKLVDPSGWAVHHVSCEQYGLRGDGCTWDDQTDIITASDGSIASMPYSTADFVDHPDPCEEDFERCLPGGMDDFDVPAANNAPGSNDNGVGASKSQGDNDGSGTSSPSVPRGAAANPLKPASSAPMAAAAGTTTTMNAAAASARTASNMVSAAPKATFWSAIAAFFLTMMFNDAPARALPAGPSGAEGAFGHAGPLSTSSTRGPLQATSAVQGPWPPPAYPGDDPAKPPGADWTWTGKPGSQPGSPDGSYTRPSPGGGRPEQLRPDLNHPPPVGPHWDWRDPNGNDWRINPDGSVTPK